MLLVFLTSAFSFHIFTNSFEVLHSSSILLLSFFEILICTLKSIFWLLLFLLLACKKSSLLFAISLGHLKMFFCSFRICSYVGEKVDQGIQSFILAKMNVLDGFYFLF